MSCYHQIRLRETSKHVEMFDMSLFHVIGRGATLNFEKGSRASIRPWRGDKTLFVPSFN